MAPTEKAAKDGKNRGRREESCKSKLPQKL